MKRYYVGLDVHSRQTTFAIQGARGSLIAQGEIATTPDGLTGMIDRYRLPEGTEVGLETGTVAFFVSRQLAALGMRPVVVDAHEVRLKAHRPTQKTDRRDAFEVCDGIRRGIYRSIVHVPPHEIAELRETLSRRRHFVRVQTAEINAAKRLLRSAGMGPLGRSLRTEAAWSKLEAALEGQGSVQARVRAHHALWRCAGTQVGELEGALAEQRAPSAAAIVRLETIPGVGEIVASTAVAILSDITRFPDAKHVGSYVGLTPAMQQTGTRDPHCRITRRGSAELRAMLCEAAQHARRPHHPLNPYFAKICAKGGYKKAVVAVAHRLCRIMYAMLRDEVDFDVSRVGVEAGPFEKKTVRAYRLKPRKATSRAVATA